MRKRSRRFALISIQKIEKDKYYTPDEAVTITYKNYLILILLKLWKLILY